MTHISTAGRLMAALPDHTDPLTGAGGPDPTMTNSPTRLGALAQHPKRVALLALAFVALLLAAVPHAASADSYYRVNGCYGSILTWGSFENLTGTNPNNYGNTENCGSGNILSSAVETSGTSQALWNAYAPNAPGMNYIHSVSGSEYVFTAAANHNAGWAAADPSWAAGQGTSGTGSINSPTASDPSNLYYGGAQAVGVTSGDCLSQSSACSNVNNNAFSYSVPDQTIVGIGIGATTTGITNYSGASIYNPSVQIDDPDTSPYLTASSSSLNSGSQWYSDATNSNVTGSATVADNSGVCDIQIDLENGSGGVVSGSSQGSLGNAPGSWDGGTGTYDINLAPGGQINAPCSGSANISTTVPLSNITTPGSYHFVETAQNPGNVEAQYNSGSANGSPTMGANDIGTILVDNQVPSVQINGGPDAGEWSSNGDQTYSISASEASNASGIASITCTGAGLPSGGKTFSGGSASVEETAQGDDAISCFATTNAGVSGADGSNQNSNVGTEGQSNDILIDTSAPSNGVDNDSPATHADGLIGDWVDPSTDGTAETVDVYAAAGVSGIAAGTTTSSTTTPATGTVDQWATSGNPVTTGVSTEASLYNTAVAAANLSQATIGGDKYGMPYCQVTDLSDPTTRGGSTYVTYNASVGSVAIGNAAATPSIDAATKYVEWQIPFTANGHYQLDCSVTNGAGVTTTLATQTIEVDNTSSAILAGGAQTATSNGPYVVDSTGQNDASNYVSDTTQSAAQWSGDPLTLTYTPGTLASAWPTTADASDPTEVDPIVQTTCVPGGDANGEQTSNTVATQVNGANPTQANANSITVGDTHYTPQADNQPATQAPTNNGNDQVVCTETNAAGTVSDPTTYYMNIDQQTPTVAYSQPSGDTGGQGSNAASASMTPAALSAKTGLPQKDFGLAPLTSKVDATQTNPIPATGHLAGAGPAEFKLNHNDSTTGVEYSDTATQVNATPNELNDLSGTYGEYCSDTNQTEVGSGGNIPQPYGDGAVLGSGGADATLDVPQTGDTSDQVTGIHSLDCYGKVLATFTGTDAQGPFAGSNAQTTHYPFSSNQAQYNYTVNIDNVSPANIGWGIVNQGETVTDPDPYTYSAGTWYPDEATLTATAQQVGNDLSDIDAVVCGVNDPSFGQPNSTYTDPVSGNQVPYYDYTLDGNAFERPTDANNDYTIEIPVSDTNGSGTYYVSCFAVSGSGVNGTVTTTEVNLQKSGTGNGTGGGSCTQFCNGQPDPSLNVPPSGIGPITGGQTWHTTSVQVPVTAQSPTGSAPIESITCNEPPATLDGDTSNSQAVDNGNGTITYPNPAGTNSNSESITVTVGAPPVGIAEPPLECYAVDGAGVDHTLGSYQVNVDNSAPTGHFIKPNASDPRKVTLYATDNNGSGIAKVVLQLADSNNKVTNLPLTSNTTGDGDYTAELPDDNTMAKGSYQLQAIVTDNAGNVTNPPIDQWASGLGSTITYPVLGSATMVDALGAGTKAPLLPGDKGTTSTKVPKTKKVRVKVHGKWVTKTVKVYRYERVKVKAKAASGKAKVTYKRKKVLVYKTVKASAKVVLANVKKPVKLAYAGKSTADGIVSTGAGVPIVGGTVQISQTVGGAVRVLGTVKTNDAGRWTYHVPAGPSRDLNFEYMGTDVIDTANGSAGAELVTGKVTLKAAKVVKVGKKLVLRGKLSGGYIPAKGVALRVYFTEKGAKGTGDYSATYHTNTKGAFTIKEPSQKSARGRTYTFWVKVVTPTSWPFNGAISKKMVVTFK